MAARTKEIVTRSLAELELDPATVGGAVATTAVLESRTPPPRGATEIVRGSSSDGAARIVEFLAKRRII
jgi:electron transfer flavoprotein beta subunit